MQEKFYHISKDVKQELWDIGLLLIEHPVLDFAFVYGKSRHLMIDFFMNKITIVSYKDAADLSDVICEEIDCFNRNERFNGYITVDGITSLMSMPDKEIKEFIGNEAKNSEDNK